MLQRLRSLLISFSKRILIKFVFVREKGSELAMIVLPATCVSLKVCVTKKGWQYALSLSIKAWPGARPYI